MVGDRDVAAAVSALGHLHPSRLHALASEGIARRLDAVGAPDAQDRAPAVAVEVVAAEFVELTPPHAGLRQNLEREPPLVLGQRAQEAGELSAAQRAEWLSEIQEVTDALRQRGHSPRVVVRRAVNGEVNALSLG
jgi:hypothetical protein